MTKLSARRATTATATLGLAVLVWAPSLPVAAAPAPVTEPVVSAPLQTFPPVGTTVPQKSAGVLDEVTRWQLLDPGSAGFSHVVVEQFNTYANSWGVVYYGTGTSYEALLSAVQFTEFRITPYDAGGNPGTTTYGQGVTPAIADDSDATAAYATQITHSSGWRRVAAATAYGGSYLRSTRAGASFTVCGYFSRIALVAPRTPAAGSASVRVFGSTHDVSLRAPSSRYREVVGGWSTRAPDGVPAGGGPTHCLTLTAKSSAPVYVDALEYNVADIIE
jgi:hypothetical protein